jgi:hypothetical protein
MYNVSKKHPNLWSVCFRCSIMIFLCFAFYCTVAHISAVTRTCAMYVGHQTAPENTLLKNTVLDRVHEWTMDNMLCLPVISKSVKSTKEYLIYINQSCCSRANAASKPHAPMTRGRAAAFVWLRRIHIYTPLALRGVSHDTIYIREAKGRLQFLGGIRNGPSIEPPSAIALVSRSIVTA